MEAKTHRGPPRRGQHSKRSESREVQISKALSKLLRHQAANAGVPLDQEGYAPLDRVLQWGPLKSLSPSLEEIKSVVTDNAKQRFTLKCIKEQEPSDDPSAYLVRANQGHSLQVDESALFTPLSRGEMAGTTVVHGTYFAFWDAIVTSGGLKPMSRGHIHCAPGENAVSGMRRDAELLVEIDVERSIAEGGLAWWRSSNGVILTDGGPEGVLSTSFFKKVSGRSAGVGILWEDGEKKADLPPGLKMVVPSGKRTRR